MAKVELKQPIVAEISEAIKEAQSVVLVDYRGLTVEQDTNLRKELREATGLGLKETKDLVDNAPKVLKEAASKEEADEIKSKLEA